MSMMNIKELCSRWARRRQIEHVFPMLRLKLAMAEEPQYSAITPSEHKGPIVAKMEGTPNRSYLEVEPVETSLVVKVDIYENRMEGLGKEGTLKITGPVSDLAQDFKLNVAKAEYSYIVGPSAKPILETDRNQGGTCVRLKEAECEADFRVKVSLRGTVGFPDEDRADEIPIAEIISDLIYEAEDGDESFERFHLGDDNDVIWTVGGKCHFYLTAPRRHD